MKQESRLAREATARSQKKFLCHVVEPGLQLVKQGRATKQFSMMD